MKLKKTYQQLICRLTYQLSPVIVCVFLVLCQTPEILGVDVFFNFNYDSSFDTNAGANSSLAKSDFNYVANYLGTVIQSTSGNPVTVQVDVSSYNNISTPVLASAGSYLAATPNTFEKGFTQALIQGATKTWTGSEAVAQINFAYNWGFGGTVASNQIDFRYVLLHEMFHALGFYSVINASGTSDFGGNNFSYYDQFIQGWDGTQYVNLVTRNGLGNPTGTIANAAAAVVDSAHPLLFNGPNVVADLGQPAQLYTPATFNNGSSISHYNYPGQLEYYAIPGTGPLNFGFSSLDTAFLKDLGYVVVPEPGTVTLCLVGVGLLAFAKLRKTSV